MQIFPTPTPLIKPIIGYPIIPNCTTSDMNKMKMEKLQNKALRFLNNVADGTLTIEQMHAVHKVEPVNVKLQREKKSYYAKCEWAG